MKTIRNQRRTGRRGFISMALVISVGLMVIAGLGFAYRRHMDALDAQAKVQIKIDYAQKEEAVLRSLLYLAPNKAIGAMKEGSAADAGQYSWDTIFEEAIDMANAETAIDAELLQLLGNRNLISANSGDANLSSTSDLISPITGSGGDVNSGLTQETSLLFNQAVGGKLPAPLAAPSAVFSNDRNYPIVTRDKVHSGAWTKGVHLSASNYPLYNLLEYPDIRFGYARPGELFVAKRNWWAFKLKFGQPVENQTGVPVLEKNYVLSIYEVPSQLPISASGFMSLGQHEDGSDWRSAHLAGGVFAGHLQTAGTVALDEGVFSARSATDFEGNTSIAGRLVEDGFDDLGVREVREAETGSNFYDASTGGNVGRVVFVPINRGGDFLRMLDDGNRSSRLSPTGWNEYTTGAVQANMRIMIWNMESKNHQLPIGIVFYYRSQSGVWQGRVYMRSYNWPAEHQSGGSSFPFQTDELTVGRPGLIVHVDRLPAFLQSLGDAGGVSINNSLYIYPDRTYSSSVIQPSYPSVSKDCAVSLRGGQDMTAYTKGFSLVTNLRLYIAESFNEIPTTPPAGSGIPSGAEYYPPVSLFAAEKRYGETLQFSHPVDFSGQISSLKEEGEGTFRPLDLKSGSNDSVNPDRITADLKRLRSPAELPPIHLMNWLVTIEEIF